MSKRKRKFRPLIQVEGGGLMLRTRAEQKVALGLARIIYEKTPNERVRFLNPTDRGYERAPGFNRWGGQQSGYAGPTVMQAHRNNKGRRGAA